MNQGHCSLYKHLTECEQTNRPTRLHVFFNSSAQIKILCGRNAFYIIAKENPSDGKINVDWLKFVK